MNNAITYIHENIGCLRKMDELNLSGNPRLRNLPPAIGECRWIEVLSLNGCNFSKLPNEVTHLSRLLELNLGNNCLQELPKDMGRLSRLAALNIADNKLSCLPSSLGLCLGLIPISASVRFDISRNPFQDSTIDARYRESVESLMEYLEELMVRFGGFPRYDDLPQPETRQLPPWNDTFKYPEEESSRPTQTDLQKQFANKKAEYKRSVRFRKVEARALQETLDILPTQEFAEDEEDVKSSPSPAQAKPPVSSNSDDPKLRDWAVSTLEVTSARLYMMICKLDTVSTAQGLMPFVNKLREMKPEFAKINQYVVIKATPPAPSDDKLTKAKNIALVGFKDCNDALEQLSKYVEKQSGANLETACQFIRRIKEIIESFA
eukprot:TRINITY_DN5354_c0_g1_i1.p1 TRINITY_DN5354_c0_g1~~TRINITY_DN5354_c0_g1_i1.p1  ORF type:complete len:377 (-),score=97.59 TRINITY_DN5354_c0_g1_i1:225-1355(-)